MMLSYKQTKIRSEDVELAEELKREVEAMSQEMMTKGPHLRRRGRKPPSNMKREREARSALPHLKDANKAIREAFGWRKFFKGTSKIRLEVVRKFYASDHNQAEYYAIMDEKSAYFNIEAINKLYNFPFDAETPDHVLITATLKRQAMEALETIAWLGAEYDITPTGKYLLYPHQLTIEASVWLFS
ncbi:hypothetical protein E5676_scaffold409G00070 [Cucumis melo var. makuwa]|uniref:Uncharacterized protein n=1 Tax=Cucumis melo var. makuwa TaxID=1194695 RepID=A0A5A7SQ81_CUCMM|nr:hypothetical protein E6C27_scaffold139G004850 [Cucumis melo var. makuwa]TYK04411.1 hypothetical protein E5676_scaffold409G00070 [Cucumis melo var. makuwa]